MKNVMQLLWRNVFYHVYLPYSCVVTNERIGWMGGGGIAIERISRESWPQVAHAHACVRMSGSGWYWLSPVCVHVCVPSRPAKVV